MQIRKALQPIPLCPAAPDWASVGQGVQLPMAGLWSFLPLSVLPSTSSFSGLCIQTSWGGGDSPASSLTSQFGEIICVFILIPHVGFSPSVVAGFSAPIPDPSFLLEDLLSPPIHTHPMRHLFFIPTSFQPLHVASLPPRDKVGISVRFSLEE